MHVCAAPCAPGCPWMPSRLAWPGGAHAHQGVDPGLERQPLHRACPKGAHRRLGKLPLGGVRKARGTQGLALPGLALLPQQVVGGERQRPTHSGCGRRGRRGGGIVEWVSCDWRTQLVGRGCSTQACALLPSPTSPPYHSRKPGALASSAMPTVRLGETSSSGRQAPPVWAGAQGRCSASEAARTSPSAAVAAA